MTCGQKLCCANGKFEVEVNFNFSSSPPSLLHLSPSFQLLLLPCQPWFRLFQGRSVRPRVKTETWFRHSFSHGSIQNKHIFSKNLAEKMKWKPPSPQRIKTLPFNQVGSEQDLAKQPDSLCSLKNLTVSTNWSLKPDRSILNTRKKLIFTGFAKKPWLGFNNHLSD